MPARVASAPCPHTARVHHHCLGAPLRHSLGAPPPTKHWNAVCPVCHTHRCRVTALSPSVCLSHGHMAACGCMWHMCVADVVPCGRTPPTHRLLLRPSLFPSTSTRRLRAFSTSFILCHRRRRHRCCRPSLPTNVCISFRDLRSVAPDALLLFNRDAAPRERNYAVRTTNYAARTRRCALADL